MGKTLYHSAARQLSPVKVTIKSDVLKSKFSKPGAPKPDYVVLEIDGTEWNYNLENPNCGEIFDGAKGETLVAVFAGGGKGKEDSATVTYADAPATEAPAPAPVRTPTPHNTASQPPPARAAAPAAPARPATPPVTLHHGAQVGMAVNNAVTYMIAEGIPFDANEIYNRASDLVRIADALENGHMAPKFSERKGNQ